MAAGYNEETEHEFWKSDLDSYPGCHLLWQVSKIPEPNFINFCKGDNYQPLRGSGKVNEIVLKSHFTQVCSLPLLTFSLASFPLNLSAGPAENSDVSWNCGKAVSSPILNLHNRFLPEP